MTKALVHLSKLLSLMLRHEPERFGLILDAEGYVPLDDVLRAIRKETPEIGLSDVVAVVDTIEPDKRRFSIVDDSIRANYGHSLESRVAHPAADPPPVLYHGTHDGAIDSILSGGLIPMRRQYVHLTPGRELAMRVGARRGRPVLVAVDANAAHGAGVAFYRANENYWLVDTLPAVYLRIVR